MTGSIRCSSKRIILNAFEIFLTIFLILRSTPAKQSQRYTAGQMMVLRPDDITDKSQALLLAIDDNSVAHKNHFCVWAIPIPLQYLLLPFIGTVFENHPKCQNSVMLCYRRLPIFNAETF